MADICIKMRWGVLCDSISEQLSQMGIVMESKKYDIVKESLNHLVLSGIFTDSQMSAMYQRAQKDLSKAIDKHLSSLSVKDYNRVVSQIEKYNKEN